MSNLKKRDWILFNANWNQSWKQIYILLSYSTCYTSLGDEAVEGGGLFVSSQPLQQTICDYVYVTSRVIRLKVIHLLFSEGQRPSYWNSKKWRSWIQWAMINCEKPSRKVVQNWLPPPGSLPLRITCCWSAYVLPKTHLDMSLQPQYSVQGARSMSLCSRTRSSLVELHQWLLFWTARILVFTVLRHTKIIYMVWTWSIETDV